MAARDDMLQQILANPADTDLQRVYADRLQAAGDPRGELIVVDLELAVAKGARSAVLAERRDALLAAHAGTWWPQLDVRRLKIRGGLVRAAALEPKQLPVAAGVLASEPITSVEIVGSIDDKKLDLLPPQVRELAVHGWLSDEGFGKICQSRLAERLVALDTSGCSLFSLAPIGTALPACRKLALGQSSLRDRVQHLEAWAHRTSLEWLDLGSCKLSEIDIARLLAPMPKLRFLRLSGNALDTSAARTLAICLAQMPSLEALELVGCQLTEPSLVQLREATRAAIVTELPARLELDLVGLQLQLVHVSGDQWAIEIDGQRRHIEFRSTVEYDGGRGPTVRSSTSGTTAPLQPLAHVLGCGGARTLWTDRVSVDISMSSGAVYNTSVWTSERVWLRLVESGTIDITLAESIDTSS